MVVVRKNLTIEKGEHRLFDDVRYFFYITNDRGMTMQEIVLFANDRCNQENVIGQLKSGVNALRMPSDGLVSKMEATVTNHNEGVKYDRRAGSFGVFLPTVLRHMCDIQELREVSMVSSSWRVVLSWASSNLPSRHCGQATLLIAARKDLFSSADAEGGEVHRLKPALLMKKHILIYGCCGGLLIVVLRLIEYRYLVIEHSIEIYGGLVAAVFAGTGIWLGIKLTKKKETVVIREVPAAAQPFAVNDARLRELGITRREREILELIATG